MKRDGAINPRRRFGARSAIERTSVGDGSNLGLGGESAKHSCSMKRKHLRMQHLDAGLQVGRLDAE